MAAIRERMSQGFAGDVTRKTESTIESGVMAETVSYGAPVKLDGNGKFGLATDEDDKIYGFVVRPYPTQADQAEKGAIHDCLRSGYMTVKLASGAAKKGAPVYVRIMADTNKKIGDIEAAASTITVQAEGENTPTTEPDNILIPDCIFMGQADADGNVEISFNV